ncbi:MAG: hypothetical protein KGI69_02345 [Patescibacteria group bacterium]|nr:hypothetical protein [Patescibacteria group bacterium]
MKIKYITLLTLAMAISASSAMASSTLTEVVPVLMPSANSPTSLTAQNALIADAMAGSLHGGPASGPSDYSVITGYSAGWSNLVYSTGAAMWQGTLQDVSGARGQVVALLVHVRSVSGGNDVSLDMLTFSGTSVDGALNGSFGFDGLSYTAQAPGKKADGTTITSGDSTQLCKEYWVIVYPPMFNGGGTQSGLDSVKNWVVAHSPYDLDYLLKVNGNVGSTVILNVVPNAVSLSLSSSGPSSVTLKVMNAEADRTYVLESRTSLVSGGWTDLTAVIGTNSVAVPTAGIPMQFFRARVQ